MKIAFVTDDGERISQHFGRAGKYLVIEVENGLEINRELRDKMGHQHFSQEDSSHEHHGGPHGFDPASQSRHASMLSAIEDCDVVICGGMGQGAFQSITASGKKVFMVENLDINENLEKYLSGDLYSSDDLVH
jgi:predicted Fe-Mo cluster-binding NifX family protein